MKCIKTTEAVGHVLCHDITRIVKDVVKDTAFRKGHIVERRIFRYFYRLEKIIYMYGKKMRILCMKMKQLRFSVTYVSMTICIHPM